MELIYSATISNEGCTSGYNNNCYCPDYACQGQED